MTKRKSSWLLLEWFGTVLLWLLPDTKPVNRFLSKLFYWVYNDFRWPDLENPQSFNEKLICEKISDEARSPERQRITDKHWVKAFVDERLGPGHTVPTLGIISDPKDVDTYEFPLPCVVKPTHSSQEVSFLDKAQPDKAERKRLKYWLWKDYFAANREPNYKGLEHKLIIEPVVGNAFGTLDDVKLLCFGGEPKLIQVDHGRFGQHARDYYDIRGQLLPVEMRKASAGRPFPFHGQLAELLRVARALSPGYRFMRVDCYIDGDRVLIGELTSFPTNCTIPFRPASADAVISQLMDDPAIEITPESFGVPAVVQAGLAAA